MTALNRNPEIEKHTRDERRGQTQEEFRSKAVGRFLPKIRQEVNKLKD